MALNAGDANCTVGLSSRIYAYLLADTRNGFSSSPTSTQLDSVRALCFASARGIVDEIAANAAVSITVTASGLQTTTTNGNPTGAPGSPQTLTGRVS